MTYVGRHAAEIEDAARRIEPHIRRTPLLTTGLDRDLRIKAECFQITGSFKPRGAFNAVLRLKAEHPETAGVIAVSSGNHAQAVALAARTAGLRAIIVIPEDANPAKVTATRALGAEVIQDGVNFANRDERARQVAGQHDGLVLIHPFDNWDVIHGQGTAAREVFTADPDIRTLVTPCGGGGLLSGSALWARHHAPMTRVIGVEPECAADAKMTLESRAVYRLPRSPETIADGVRTVSIGERNFEVMVEQHLVDEIVTVSEEQIGQATRIAWLRLKLALEPTGALPLAAYLNGLIPRHGPTGLILTGGNADQKLVARLLGQP